MRFLSLPFGIRVGIECYTLYNINRLYRDLLYTKYNKCYILYTNINLLPGKQMNIEANLFQTIGPQSAALLAGLYDRAQSMFTLADAQEITGLTPHLASSLLL